METDPRLWKFIADMNFDGSVTSRDLWLWATWLFFYPGDLFILLFIKVFPGFAHFLRSYESLSGRILSFTLSLIVWILVFIIGKRIVGAVQVHIEHHDTGKRDSKVRKFFQDRGTENWKNQGEEDHQAAEESWISDILANADEKKTGNPPAIH